jgi:murein DD-endopeptidase MepM/ murein hydrolase activator NlpD
MKKAFALILVFSIGTFSFAHADTSPVLLTGNFVQGGLIRGAVEPGSTISLDGKSVRVNGQGQFIFGFGYGLDKPWLLTATLPNGEKHSQKFDPTKRKFNVQRIDGLPKSKVSPSKKFIARIRKENGEIARIRQLDTAINGFSYNFIWPAQGRISGVYGSQRILNGIPKQPHFGVDVAAPTGTPIVAPAPGIVRMAEDDLFYTGGTVMIDHGHGIISVFSHLNKVTAKVGTTVAPGDKIGTLGKTGRATGPHLDYRVNWFGERLDPQLFLPKMK